MTKQSTYVRPIEAQQGLNDSTYTTQSEAQQHKADPNSFNGTGSAYDFPHRNFFGLGNSSRGRGGFRGEHTDRQQPSVADRPKSKHALPGCQPWLLVKTKLGRRFVHNLETGESFWKFPVDVMKSVVEFDRLEREKKIETRLQRGKNIEDNEVLKLESSAARKEESFFHASAGDEAHTIRGEDDEDYEELEVTDDEEDENPSKRQRTEDMGSEEPIEFNEDDIAYQLASMGQDYGLDPGEYGDGRDEDLEDGAEGLTLTEYDTIALFKDMLDDHRISPFTTWEKVIEAGQIVEDHRYVVLSNMKSRKDIWAMWSRDKIQLLKGQRERMEKQDPRIPYLSFLQSYATPKLYWPEFRRKYRKEPELRDVKLSDKDREKLYRDYINRKSILE